MNKETNCEFTIKPTEGRTIKFKGIFLGKSCTSPNNAFSNYSGSTGRWEEYSLYQTVGKKYICVSMKGTQWQGCQNVTKVKVCESIEEIARFFENGFLLNDLLEECNVAYETLVE